jgi:hypothetical protein
MSGGVISQTKERREWDLKSINGCWWMTSYNDPIPIEPQMSSPQN